MALRLSPKWIQSFCKTDLSIQEISDHLSQYGFEAELVEDIKLDPGLVIGEVIEVSEHPQADKLRICKVDCKDQVLQIVCGCPSVVDAKYVIVAPIGAKLPNMTLKPVQLRGVESQGMICSLVELGLAEAGKGIYHFQDPVIPGTALVDYLEHDSVLLEIDVTPNRGDCLSVYGIARDLAASLNVELVPYPTGITLTDAQSSSQLFSVQSEAVMAYDALSMSIASDSQVPLYMANRLRQAGMGLNHPCVDILNYIMLELGQPMHAFDQSMLSLPLRLDEKPGETFSLLNDTVYTSKAHDLLVLDQKGAQALAGIMGGKASGCHTQTTAVQLESAVFSPKAIAKSLRQNNLNSDASYRYERGVAFDLNTKALAYCVQLCINYLGAEVIEYQSYRREMTPNKIAFSSQSINAILGIDLSEEMIGSILNRLQIEVENNQAMIPSYRYDLSLEVDLAEEVARLYGYNNIPLKPMSGLLAPVFSPRPLKDSYADALVALGFHEVVQFSFVSEELLRLLPQNRGEAIQIDNPIHAQFNFMRQSVLQSLLLALKYNKDRQYQDIQLFEVGETFALKDGAVVEETELAALMIQSDEAQLNYYDIQKIVLSLLKDHSIAFQVSERSYLHPNQSANIIIDHQVVGYCGLLHPRVCRSLGLPRSACLVLDLNQCQPKALPSVIKPSKYPMVYRDVTVTLAKAIKLGEIEEAVWSLGDKILKHIQIKSIYSVDAKTQNVTWSIGFQSTQATLKEQQIATSLKAVHDILKRN